MCDVTSQQDNSLSTLKRNMKDFSMLAGKVNSIAKIDGRRLVFRKSAVSRMDQDEINLLLADKMKAASKIDIYDDIRKLIRLTQESYNLLTQSYTDKKAPIFSSPWRRSTWFQHRRISAIRSWKIAHIPTRRGTIFGTSYLKVIFSGTPFQERRAISLKSTTPRRWCCSWL